MFLVYHLQMNGIKQQNGSNDDGSFGNGVGDGGNDSKDDSDNDKTTKYQQKHASRTIQINQITMRRREKESTRA